MKVLMGIPLMENTLVILFYFIFTIVQKFCGQDHVFNTFV